MKKNILTITLISLFSGLFATTPTWDILDKSMDALAPDWEYKQGGSAGGSATPGEEDIEGDPVNKLKFINVTKTSAATSQRWAWGRPINALADLTTGIPYSIEIKARVHPVGIPDAGSYFEANQIALRLKSINMATPIYLKYGDGVTGGLVSATSGASDSNVKALNTSEWHIYRIVLNADHSSYNVFIDGEQDPIFVNVKKPANMTVGDYNGVYFGAESYHRCNIDIEYVKMGTGDFFTNREILSVDIDPDTHIEGTEATISVVASTSLINDNEKLLISFLDKDDADVITPVEIIVTDNKAEGSIVIPSTTARGSYTIKVSAPNDEIGGVAVAASTQTYEILADPTSIQEDAISESVSISTNVLTAGQAVVVKSHTSELILSEVVLYNVAGDEIYRKSVSEEECTIEAPKAQGVYLLDVKLSNGVSKILKVLVK